MTQSSSSPTENGNTAGPQASRAPAQTTLPFPLQDGEEVLKLCRRHWIFFWPMVLFQSVVAIVPVVVLAVLLNEAGALEGIGILIFLVLAAVWLVYWAARVVLTWYRYHHDIWVITNQRVIDSHRRHPFDLLVSTADLVNVQDMSVERNGILRTLLDYGDIVCQTASIDQDFRISGVPDPRSIQALVDRERDRERARRGGTQV